MKRLLLGLCCALFLSASLSATSNAGPKGAGADSKVKKSKTHREKHHREKREPLHKFPKTVGWWHHRGPGPAGAGVK